MACQPDLLAVFVLLAVAFVLALAPFLALLALLAFLTPHVHIHGRRVCSSTKSGWSLACILALRRQLADHVA